MTKKVKVKAGDEKSITVQADRDLFGRLLIVTNTHQINLMEVLSYELSPIPCSLAHQDRSLRKSTKRLLAGVIEKLVTVVPQLQPSPENTIYMYILDGVALIQMIKSGHTATFGKLAKHYFNTFTSPLSTHKSYCVRVVFDQYLDDSIKAGEQARRGSSSPLEVYIGGPATPVPKQWDKYISNLNNKKNLCDFLTHSMCNLGQRHLWESTQLVIRGGFKDGERCVAITRDSCVDVLMWRILKSSTKNRQTRG